jgi:hypothetical protein
VAMRNAYQRAVTGGGISRLRAAVGDVWGRLSRASKGGRGRWCPGEAESGQARAGAGRERVTASMAGRAVH